MEQHKDTNTRKDLLEGTILRALSGGAISDETSAYIQALGYAANRNPKDVKIQNAIYQVLQSVTASVKNKEENKEYNNRLAQEKLGEGLVENFGMQADDRLVTSIPNYVISYLAQQKFLLIPLNISSSSIADIGEYQDQIQDQETSRKMYALNDHWVGLYFQKEPQLMSENTAKGAHSSNPANPVAIENTILTFIDANLNNTDIDLFFPNLAYQIQERHKAGNAGILHFTLVFKNCLVRNMKLLFWHHIFHFPGSVTIKFENCEDFDETDFSYLKKDREQIFYYIDIEKFIQTYSATADPYVIDYAYNVLSQSDLYKHEHLR